MTFHKIINSWKWLFFWEAFMWFTALLYILCRDGENDLMNSGHPERWSRGEGHFWSSRDMNLRQSVAVHVCDSETTNMYKFCPRGQYIWSQNHFIGHAVLKFVGSFLFLFFFFNSLWPKIVESFISKHLVFNVNLKPGKKTSLCSVLAVRRTFTHNWSRKWWSYYLIKIFCTHQLPPWWN